MAHAPLRNTRNRSVDVCVNYSTIVLIGQDCDQPSMRSGDVMELRRAAVLGGGPGGLYAARLLKLARPSCDVVVYEQGEPGTTFGFGVGLASGTQRNLE